MEQLIKLLIRHYKEIGIFFSFLSATFFACLKFYKNCCKPIKAFWDRLLRILKEFENNGGGSLKDKINKTTEILEKLEIRFDSITNTVDSIEARQKAMLNESPSATFIFDEEGSCLDANKAFVKMTGLRKDLAKGHGWHKIIHTEDIERIEQEWIEFIDDGDSFETTLKIVQYHNRDIMKVRFTGTKGYNSNGELLSVICTIEII
jgi:PAS domain S-box-containing protein